MSIRPPPEPLGQVMQQVATLAERSGVQVALIGALARWARGGLEPVETVEVAANAPPDPVGIEALPSGGEAPRGGIPVVHWGVRGDEFAPLYTAAITAAQRLPGWPLPVARPEHLAAMLLAARRPDDHERLIAWIAAGLADGQAARQAVLELLGPYAIADFEALAQEAEWRAMRQRYEGGEVH